MEEIINIMSQVFTEADKQRLEALVPDMTYFIENEQKFALRRLIPGAVTDTFVITSSAYPEDFLIYETPADADEIPLNFDVRDGGFF